MGNYTREDGVVYGIAPGVETLDFDTSLPGNPLLVAVGKKYLQVSGLAKELVIFLKSQPSSISDIEAHFQPSDVDEGAEERLHEALNGLLDRTVVTSEAARGSQAKGEDKRNKRASYMMLKIPILPEVALRPLTSRLARLFELEYVKWILPVMLLTQLFLWWYLIKGLLGVAGSLRGYDYAVLLIGNYFGLLLHELGHASACTRCGVRHGPIGVGIYLIFPAFYTDVTAAWRLPRLQRMLVDAGGIYMNLLGATVFLLAYDFTHRPVFIVLAGMYDMVVWWSLWPFVRMDGYWLISDLLGIPNLMSANLELTKWLVGRIWKRNDHRPAVLSIEPLWGRAIYFLYYALFVASMFAMAFGLTFWYIPRLTRSAPRLVGAIFAQIRVTGLSPRILGLLARLFFTMVPLYAISRLLLRGMRLLRQRLKGASSWFFRGAACQAIPRSSGER